MVMPDAGNSWYVNWAENADGQTNNWADHIVRDVVNHVDWHYRTIAKREGHECENRQAKGMKLRQDAQHGVTARKADVFDRLANVGTQVAMREHDTLWFA